MTKTYADRTEVPVKNQTFDPTAKPENHGTPTDEKNFGVRKIEDELAEKSEDPRTDIAPRPLDR